MSEERIVRFFVDLRNFIGGFWPEGMQQRFALRELDWYKLTRAIVEYAQADSYDRIYCYDAFSGGEMPKDLRRLSPELRRLVGLEVENNPKFVVRPGYSITMSKFNKRGDSVAWTREKAVDTQIVVDMTRGALRNEYDVAVLFSGDLDMKPGIVEVVESGLECIVCGWGTRCVSSEILAYIEATEGVSYLDLTILGTGPILRVSELNTGTELSSGEFAMCALLHIEQVLSGGAPVSALQLVQADYLGLPSGEMNRYGILRKLKQYGLVGIDSVSWGPHANVRIV